MLPFHTLVYIVKNNRISKFIKSFVTANPDIF